MTQEKTEKPEGMTYAGTGVNYEEMDPWKRVAQAAGLETAGNIQRFGFKEFAPSRGESAYLIETPWGFLAHVEEGLGTKDKVAHKMHILTGKSYWNQTAQCTAAMIFNDIITVGALPVSSAMHLAVGDSSVFNDPEFIGPLSAGWKHSCNLARCVWGGGETPTLKDTFQPGSMVLAGSALGIINPKERLALGKIRHWDAIVFVESSGVHANGITLARKIADKLPDGYLTALPDGRTYGETLLDPTHIYVGLVEDCFKAGVDIHYGVNVTGHGWRKLMRAEGDFTYVIDALPTQLPIFDFIMEYGPVDVEEAYGNFNMGVGFALYVPEKDVDRVIQAAALNGQRAFRAGCIESGEKKVIIRPLGITFGKDSLAVR